MEILNLKKIKFIDPKYLNIMKLDNKSINLINVDYNQKNGFEKITKNQINLSKNLLGLHLKF